MLEACLQDDLVAAVDRLPVVGARLSVGPVAGPRWLALGPVLDGGLDLLVADAEGTAADRGYVGATVAAALARAAVDAGWPLVLLERRLPDLRPDNLVGHRAESACWFDRVALRRAAGAVTGDVAALHEHFADGLVATLSPWFAAVGGRARFGRAGMWGQTADLLAGTAVWAATAAGADPAAAWDEAAAVIDLVAARLPGRTVRPRALVVGGRPFPVKGTCCLWYRTQPGADPRGEGYCLTCPLRPDDDRVARLGVTTER